MYSTQTKEGEIAHKRLVTSCGVIYVPVKLIVGKQPSNGVEPMRKHGRLVYALPGGGEVLGD